MYDSEKFTTFKRSAITFKTGNEKGILEYRTVISLGRSVFFFSQSSPKDMFLLIFRARKKEKEGERMVKGRRGRERERHQSEREKQQLVSPVKNPTGIELAM